MPILELNNNIVSITDEGLYLPEFKALQSLKDKDGKDIGNLYLEVLDYIYHVYDKRSIYYDILPNDRKKIVCQDRKLDFKLYLWLENKSKEFRASVEKLNKLQFTPNERLLQGSIEKIEEYLEFWQDTKITEKTHDLVASTLENSEKLLKLKERITRIVMDESQTKNTGGHQPRLFEEEV